MIEKMKMETNERLSDGKIVVDRLKPKDPGIKEMALRV